MHSWVYISDLKIEVTFPRPGDTFVPPGRQTHWIRVTSRPGQVPGTRPTNRVYLRCSGWGPCGSSHPLVGVGDPHGTPVEAVPDDFCARVGRIGFMVCLLTNVPPWPGTLPRRRRPIHRDRATPASQWCGHKGKASICCPVPPHPTECLPRRTGSVCRGTSCNTTACRSHSLRS